MKQICCVLLVAIVALCSSFARGASADDWLFTGSSVRIKSVGPFHFNVYAIRHDIKGRPAKSRQAVIDADMDKKLTWRMLRDADSAKIQNGMREAFALNGYTDASKIGRFVGAFSHDEVKENSAVVITYTSATKTTSIWVADGSAASVQGEEFMRAAWSVWLGKSDQPSLGDELIARL